jgi:aryl-alcohol dehydrogenase-like predicted oxidoreductase
VSIVASKCGFNAFGDGSVTNSAAHIKEYIEGTIERLGFTPDLYYLHRIDPSKLGIIRDGNGSCADTYRHASRGVDSRA